MKRRRWIASVMLLLIILLPVGRMVGEPTSFFKSLEVKVRPHEEKEAQGRTSQGREIEQILKAWEQKE